MKKNIAIFFSLAILINIFLSPFFVTKKVSASGPVVDVWEQAMKSITKIAINLAVNQAIAGITKSITNWANTGFQGAPAFSQNIVREFKKVEGDAIEQTLNKIKINNVKLGSFLCGPFSDEINNAFRVQLAYQREDDQLAHSSCTVDKILKEAGYTMTDFENDFNKGGWPAWFELTNNPVNNRYGLFITLQQGIWSKQAQEVTMLDKEVSQGSGFFAFKQKGECLTYANQLDPNFVGPGRGTLTSDSMGPFKPDEEGCVERGPAKTATPGSVTADGLFNALGLPGDRLVAADEINEMISSVLIAFVKKVFTSATGLIGASGTGGYNEELQAGIDAEAATEQLRAETEAEKINSQMALNDEIENTQTRLDVCLADLSAIQQQLSCSSDSDGGMTCETKIDQAKYDAKKHDCDLIWGTLDELKKKLLDTTTQQVTDAGSSGAITGENAFSCFYPLTGQPASKNATLNVSGPVTGSSKPQEFSIPMEAGKFYGTLTASFDVHTGPAPTKHFAGIDRTSVKKYGGFTDIGIALHAGKIRFDNYPYYYEKSGSLPPNGNYHITIKLNAESNTEQLIISGDRSANISVSNAMSGPDMADPGGVPMTFVVGDDPSWTYRNISVVMTPGGPYHGGVRGVCGL